MSYFSLTIDLLYYRINFSFQPVLHDWCNKGCGMCYPVYGMMHIKEPLLLIGNVAHVAGAGFLSHYLNGPLPYVWCHTPINKMCGASLNKAFPSFLKTTGWYHQIKINVPNWASYLLKPALAIYYRKKVFVLREESVFASIHLLDVYTFR